MLSRTIVADTQHLDSTWHHSKKRRSQSFQHKLNSKAKPMRSKFACFSKWRHNANWESCLTSKNLSDILWRWCWKKEVAAVAQIVHSLNHSDSNVFLGTFNQKMRLWLQRNTQCACHRNGHSKYHTHFRKCHKYHVFIKETKNNWNWNRQPFKGRRINYLPCFTRFFAK